MVKISNNKYHSFLNKINKHCYNNNNNIMTMFINDYYYSTIIIIILLLLMLFCWFIYVDLFLPLSI